MSDYQRVVPNVSVQTNRHYGPAASGSMTRTFHNFTGRVIFLTDLAGFRRAHLPVPAPSKELQDKLVIEDRYNLRETAFQEMHQAGVTRDPNTVGPHGKDPVTTFCNTPVPNQVHAVRTVEYMIDIASLDADKATILENLGLMAEFQSFDPKPYPDNSFVLSGESSDEDDVEDTSEVSFYQSVKLIDPLQEIGPVFINVRGQAQIVRPVVKGEGRAPEGLYLTSGSIDKRGRLKKETIKYELHEVIEDNGFYRNQRDAFSVGSTEVMKKNLELDTIEAKYSQSVKDLELKRLDNEAKALELKYKRLEQAERRRERLTAAYEKFASQVEVIAKSERERAGSNLKFLADVGKSIAAIMVAVGGMAKIIATLKSEPS